MTDALLSFSVIPSAAPSAAHFLILGGLSAMVMGAAKAGFAGSVGALAVPILIYACGGHSALALGMMLPMLIVCDYVAVAYWRGRWDWRNVRMLLPGMALGIAAGSVVLWQFLRIGRSAGGRETSNAALNLTIGAIALAFVGLQLYRRLRGGLTAFRPVTWHGLVAGTAAGVTSTLAHSAGAITTMYLLPQEMPKQRYVATTTLYYWIGNQAKLLPYALLGQLNGEALSAAAGLLPAVVAGAALGFFLHHRVNQKIFTGVVYVLLAGVGGDLVVRSVLALWG